ncbi:MAG: GNAT family N-acetyltransferase [Bacillota bacterium]
MKWTLRTETTPADYKAMARLRSLITGESVSTEEVQERYDLLPEGSILHLVIAESEAGRFLGYGEAFRYATTLRGKFYVNVAVDPAHRGQGIGGELAAEIERFTAGHGAALLCTEVEDRDLGSVAFAERRGYQTRRHGYSSWLDLRSFELARYSGLLAAAREGGFRFFTLADDPSDAMKQQLYELYAETMVDIPGYEAERFMAYETWHKMVTELSGTRPDWVFIAAEGSRLAGVTTAVDRETYVYTNHTLVRREFRGRGLALALKLLAIEAALRHGATRMSTGNDSRNGPMLAVNQRLGYVPESGTYEMVKRPHA